MREQYEKLTKVFKDSGYKDYSSYTGAGGDKKSPLISTLESLRKDIGTYSDKLGLNPKALESITAEKKAAESPLARALNGIK
jgi:phage terminase small subunit